MIRSPLVRLAILLLPLLALLLPPLPAWASERPRIGLALSGGGARGAAHVGVLKHIERLGIPIDYIAGTSMGSIVGGLYAMGMSADEIEVAIEEIDWDSIFQDIPPREERRMIRKLDDRTFLFGIRPGVNEREREINLVPALIQGQTLELVLRRYTLPSSTVTDFDQLAIPFRAVATDVVNGDAVILRKGDLATAMRASMAVPAVFAPVEMGDLLLVDGGLAMNLPISVVRGMGADIVIAVDVGGPRRGREEIGNVLQMLDQLAALATFRNTSQEIATLTPRDVLIVPELGHEVLATEFNKMPEAIAIGETAAEGAHARLAALSRSGTRAVAASSRTDRNRFQPPVIDRVRIENRSRLDDAILTERLEVPLGEPLDSSALEDQIATIFDQDVFESVRYRVEPSADGGNELIITAEEKSWGTSSLQGGLELSSTSSGDSRFNIGLAYTMAPVTRYNAEWRTSLTLGEEPGLFTQLYLPLDPRERWFLGAEAGYLSENLTLYDGVTARRPVAEYQLTRFGAGLHAGRNLGDWGRMRLSYTRYTGDGDLRLGGADLADFSFEQGALSLSLLLDTLDNLSFPRDGWSGSVFALSSRQALGASSDYDQAGLSLLRARSWDRHSLVGGLTLATNFGGEIPPQAFYRLGGFLNLSGLSPRELSGANLGLARAAYFYDLGTSLVRTYAGGSIETGNTWARRGDIGLDTLRVGGSLFVGADTPIGPLYLAYGIADGGDRALYLYMGLPWGRSLGSFED